jgi:hypothetical protein
MQLASWRPTGETAIVHVASPDGQGGRLIAVSASGAPPTVLARVDRIREWRPTASGEYIVAEFTIGSAPYAVRVALLDLRAGTARWISPGESGDAAQWPVISPDLRYVYYGLSHWTDSPIGGTGRDDGIFRVGLDGSGSTRVVGPSPRPPTFAIPREVTPDGLLVWGLAYEGATIEVLELANGKNISSGTGGLIRVRNQRPRFLIWYAGGVGPAHGLVTWDHSTGVRVELASDDILISGGDWSPDGRQIVAALHPKDADTTAKLTIMDERGGGRRELQTPTAVPNDPIWGNAGIYYRLADQITGLSSLRLVDPNGPDRLFYAAPGQESVYMFRVVGL